MATEPAPTHPWIVLAAEPDFQQGIAFKAFGPFATEAEATRWIVKHDCDWNVIFSKIGLYRDLEHWLDIHEDPPDP